MSDSWTRFATATENRSASSQTPPWIQLAASNLRSDKGASFALQQDGSYLVTGTNADFDVYTFQTETNLPGITSLRLEALADDSMNKRGPGRAGNGNFGLSRISLTAAPLAGGKSAAEVKLLEPQVTFQQNDGNLSIAGSLDDNPKSGWAVDPKFGQDHAATFALEQPAGFAAGTRLTIRLEFNVNNKHNFGRFRLAVSANSRTPGDGRPVDRTTGGRTADVETG